ncbi:MAG TPA: hypothetical protein VJR89_41990 [Polyangiales bacterium]|nr:hypothetical protein [Polyangiales bacterium]
MKRLLESRDASPLVQRAQELVAAAEPIDASVARGERIRRALDRPRGVKALWVRLPALTVAGFVLLFGASSFAALKLWSVATHTEPPAAAPEPAAADGGKAKPRGPRRGYEEPSTPQPPATDVSVDVPVSPQPSAARSNRVQRSARRVARPSEKPRETAAPAELDTPAQAEYAPAEPEPAAPSLEPARGPNSELVVRAVRALRREGDPARAAQLLDEYRARRTTDPLREEVLALQIEAAVANDDPRSARFAREYLARYPAGRYAQTARRALGEPGP